MIESPQNLKDQLLNLTETIAVEMKTLKDNKLDKTGKAIDSVLADKAKADEQGNIISTTYATKSELEIKAPIENPVFIGNVSASTFSGELSGNAYSATRDSDGNIISTTYATKVDLNSKQPTGNYATKEEVALKADANNVVNSFNGQKGDIKYTAPVTSVNGQTGIIDLYTSSTSDLQSGVSSLKTNKLYFVYE